MLTQDDILGLYKKYWDTIDRYHKGIILTGFDTQGMGPIEGFLLYFLLLEKNPRYTIELGPRIGYSTACIALALQKLGKKNSFATFELQTRFHEELISNLKNTAVYPDYVEIIYGNAIGTRLAY